MAKAKTTNNDIIEAGDVIVHEEAVITQMLPVPTHGAPIVTPAVAIDEAVKAYQAYQQLDQRILSDEDYIFYVQYKQGDYDKETAFGNPTDAETFAQKVGGRVVRRKRKSAFRKLANFFGLTLPEQEELLGSELLTVEDGYVLHEWGKGWQGFCFMNRAFHVFRQQYTGGVVHKNSGTTYIGVGACSVDERTKGRDGWKQRDHTIIGTAWTRMLSRGISDVIGLGEVSAEEIQSLEEIETEYTPPPEVVATRQAKHATPAPPVKPSAAPITPEGGLPHWGKVFEAAWNQLKVNRTQVMELFPGKSQEDLLEEYGTLGKVFEAISDRVAITKAGGSFEEEEIPPARPFDALNLQIWLKAKAAEFDQNWEKKEGLIGGVVGLLDKVTGGTEQRHAFLEAVFGDPSSKSREYEETWAMWKWLNSVKDKETGEWIPDAMSVQEAKAIVAKAKPRSAQEDIDELFPD